MRRVLLTHSNHLYSDPKQVEKMQPYPPLGTILAAAVLRANGIAVYLFDSTFASSESAFRCAIARVKPDLVAVCEDDFNFLSKMCLTRNRELAFRWARTSADQGIPCVAHGSDASDRACAYLDAGFNAVLIGEPEQSLLDIAQGRCPSEIDGLIWRDENNTYRNRPRAPLPDLDLLPAPAWDLVDVEAYRAAWKERHGYFSLNLASSRGCPYRCNWCAKPIYGNRYRARPAKSVAEEMLHLKREYAPDRIWFADDIFALSARWTRDFAKEVERLGAAIPFKMQSRCDLMARETVAALRRSGCEEVWMGAESGSRRVLDRMEKDLAVEEIYAARDNLRRHGIRACFFLQFGYAGETWNDIEATIRMVRETSPDDVGISVSYPLPGTKFHQIVSSRMGAKANWDHSADLSIMFRGAFSTEFYRALADALHLEIRGGADRFAAWSRVEQLRLEAVA
ncbi:MAG TPA: radical SAM protein [Bryobacteraceae bacterium]|nr:radical SAM protein [Bryobacteraceae bacterium]